MKNLNENKISFCTEPWTNLFLRYKGRVQPCCMNSTHLGDIHTDSLDEIWNGEEIQKIRRLVKEHRYEEAGCKLDCSIIYELNKKKEKQFISNELETSSKKNSVLKTNIDTLKNDLYNNKVTIKSNPMTFDIQPVEACNMSCIMCHQDHNNKDKVSAELIEKLFKYTGSIFSVRFQGGEIFVDNNFVEYLLDLKSKLIEGQKIDIITNASLLSFDDIDKLTQGNNPINFAISMDATEKDLYKYIRKSSHFDKVKENIEYLANIQKNKKGVEFINWAFVVMKSNFYNIKPAIELSAQLNISLSLAPIIGDYKEENIFKFSKLRESNYKKYLEEAFVLKDKLNAKVNNLEKVYNILFANDK